MQEGSRAGGRRLRGQHSVSNGADLHGPELCRRRSIIGAALAAGSGSAPAQGTERARPVANADAARRTSLNRPSRSPSRCRPTHGMTSHGARASTKRCVPVSPSYAFGPRIGTPGTRNPSLFSCSPSRILIERRRFWSSLRRRASGRRPLPGCRTERRRLSRLSHARVGYRRCWIRRECWSWATTKERRCRSISRLIASPPNWGIFLCH